MNLEHKSRFQIRFSERKLLLAVVDVILLNLSLLLLAYQSVFRFSPNWLSWVWDRAYWFVIFTLIWFVFGGLIGVYDLARAASPLRSAWVTGGTALVVTCVYLLLPFLAPALPSRRIEIFAFPLLVTTSIIIWRILYAIILAQPSFHQRALVVGAGRAGQLLAEAIANNRGVNGNPYDGTGYEVIGFVDDALEKQQKLVSGIPVLGTSESLISLVKLLHPYEVVIAITHRNEITPKLFQAILDCREMGVPVTTMTDLYEVVAGRIPVEHAGQNLEVVLPIRRPASFRFYIAMRRLFDIIIALAGVVCLGVLTPIIWFINRLTDPGDIFYRQERVGLGGRPFSVIKFRSMVMEAEKYTGAVWAELDDPRITRMGRILRKTRLDEVPQFWNVLKGEMSLIGPRPERPHFVRDLAEEIPFYRVRHAIKPGITGWAQVKYRYGASKEDALIKLEYDLYYIKNQSAFLDIQILLKTIQVMLGFKGR